jgi:hypothetical protein
MPQPASRSALAESGGWSTPAVRAAKRDLDALADKAIPNGPMRFAARVLTKVDDLPPFYRDLCKSGKMTLRRPFNN